MRIAFLSRNPRLYSTERLAEAATERGHEALLLANCAADSSLLVVGRVQGGTVRQLRHNRSKSSIIKSVVIELLSPRSDCIFACNEIRRFTSQQPVDRETPMNAASIFLFAILTAFVAFKLAALAVAALWSVHAVFGKQESGYNIQLPPQATQASTRK